MKFTFTEKRIQISDELKQYAEKKIGKLDKFFKAESDAYVTCSQERGRYVAEVTINNNGVFYRVKEITSDMHASIDSAVASIERQIRKNKTRLAKKLKEGVLEREYIPLAEEEPEEKDFTIVRSKHFSIKPMTVEEAILQMNLLNHQFFAFKDQTNGDLFAVVYRRNDGGYGLIEDV